MSQTFEMRAPLVSGRFMPLPPGSVRAEGALRDRLIALRAGLIARSSSIAPEAGEASNWFGGALHGGMAAPCLLEAKLLTAAALGDDELRGEALRLCRLAAAAQRPDGSFGAEGESLAATGRMLRAMTTAYSMTGDAELLRFLLRYFKYLRERLKAQPLGPEDAMHIADTLQSGLFFYNVTGQKAVLPVLNELVAQGAGYTKLFHAFPYRLALSRMVSAQDLREGLAGEAPDGYYHSLLRTADGANLCEGLRTAALSGVLTGNGKHLNAPEVGLSRMLKSHGAACGGIHADPLLGGTHPSRGVSAQSVAALAASLETLFSCPDGWQFADIWETLVYNAAAAACPANGLSVQSVQQDNQVSLTAAERFPLLGKEANLYTQTDVSAIAALLPVFPRFVRAQWMASQDAGLAAMGYAACRVRARLGGAHVLLRVSSAYPNDGAVRIRLGLDRSVAFPLHLRIPAWARGSSAAVGGDVYTADPGSILTINREWHDADEILLTLPMQAETMPGFHQAVSFARGPLRFAYAPESDETTDEQGRTVRTAKSGFAIAIDGRIAPEVVSTEDGSPRLAVRAVPLPGWGLHGASCDQPPIDLPVFDDAAARTVFLVPYADAPIRLSVLPIYSD